MRLKSWGELIPPMTRARIAILAALLVVAYWASIRSDLVGRWMNDGNWSHGWLIPLFSLYFLASRREALSRVRSKPNYLGAVVLVLSLLAYFVSSWVLRMAYPRAVSLIGAILGLTLLLGGWGVIRVAWFPILFLMFAIPLPKDLYNEITLPLREIASTLTAALMPVFHDGLYTEAQAVVIDYVVEGQPPGQLNVEEACSGMRTMMAILTLGVAISYLRDRALWARIAMVLSCFPIAILCNAARVTVTGLFIVNGRSDLASGTPHALLGVVMYAAALGLFLAIGYVLDHLFVVDEEAAAEPV